MGITNVLYNRSEFLEKAQEFLDACESSGWCIISIDIERFKLFNNWYGQEAGDILLQNISQYPCTADERIPGWLFRWRSFLYVYS